MSKFEHQGEQLSRRLCKKIQVPLEVVPPLDPKQLNGLKLSLSGDHQYTNAALVVALCRCWLQKTTSPKDIFQNGQSLDLPPPLRKGLATAGLSERAQIFYGTQLTASDTSEMKESSSGDTDILLRWSSQS